MEAVTIRCSYVCHKLSWPEKEMRPIHGGGDYQWLLATMAVYYLQDQAQHASEAPGVGDPQWVGAIAFMSCLWISHGHLLDYCRGVTEFSTK